MGNINCKDSCKLIIFSFSGVAMFCFLKFIVEFIFNLQKSQKDLLIQIAVLQKEVEILKRSNKQKRLNIEKADRVILAIINSISPFKEKLTIVRPETIL
jgi:hypothetical protein